MEEQIVNVISPDMLQNILSHMGNETGCPSGTNPGEAGCLDVISLVGCLSVNMSLGVIRRLLRRNPS